MNNLATTTNTALTQVNALPTQPPKVGLEYGATGYDKEQFL